MLHPGAYIDRWEVLGLLGRGGMAEVYKLRHRQLHTLHALKVLAPGFVHEEERLLLEGLAQAQLKHPNIVPVTDVLDVGGVPGLLMEFVDGPSLDRFLERGPPDTATAERLFRGIVSGVAYAHARGIIHRDLKPANVFLADDVPKVADFGLAKVLGAADLGNVGLTRTGVAMGTPAYMPPEQYEDAARVDHRADLFALGCILYELLSGRRAFQGLGIVAIGGNIAAGRWERLAGAPPHLARALRGCLEPDPSARLADCASLLAVLDGALPATRMADSVFFRAGPDAAADEDPRPSPPADPPPGVGGTWGGEAPRMVAAAQPDVAAPVVHAPAPAPAPAEATPAPALPPPTGRGASSWNARPALLLACLVVGMGGMAALLWPRPPAPESAREPAPVVPVGPPAESAVATPAVSDPGPAPLPTAPAPVTTPPPAANPKPRPTGAGTPQATPAAVAAPVAREGFLNVNCVPHCTVITIDDAAAGASPVTAAPVASGTRRVGLRAFDGRTATRSVHVSPGSTSDLCWDFDLDGVCSTAPSP